MKRFSPRSLIVVIALAMAPIALHGSICSAKFTQGTSVTLTAIPPAGKTFASWSGACSGTAPTCTVTIAKDTSVQANFNK